jgi:hypothetical protein
MSEFERDKNWSETTLAQVVWPAIQHSQGGVLISVEGDSGVASRQMDMTSGIDALIMGENGIKTLANRVQRTSPSQPWNTFTIRAARITRAKTEYDKRKTALEDGDALLPSLTMQAYVSNIDNRFISACTVRTRDLFEFIKEVPDKVKIKRTFDAIFKVVRWRDLAAWMISKNIRGSMRVFKVQAEFNELVH